MLRERGFSSVKKRKARTNAVSRYRKGFRVLVRKMQKYMPAVDLCECIQQRVEKILHKKRTQNEINEIASCLSRIKKMQTYIEEEDIDRIVCALFADSTVVAVKRIAKKHPDECIAVAIGVLKENVLKWTKKALYLLTQAIGHVDNIYVLVDAFVEIEKIDQKQLHKTGTEEGKILKKAFIIAGRYCKKEVLYAELEKRRENAFKDKEISKEIKSICKIASYSVDAYSLLEEIQKEEDIFTYLIAAKEILQQHSLHILHTQKVLQQIMKWTNKCTENKKVLIKYIQLVASIVKRKDCPIWVQQYLFTCLAHKDTAIRKCIRKRTAYKIIVMCLSCLSIGKKKEKWSERILAQSKIILDNLEEIKNKKKKQYLMSDAFFLIEQGITDKSIDIIQQHLSRILEYGLKHRKKGIEKIVYSMCAKRETINILLQILERDVYAPEIIEAINSADLQLVNREDSSRILSLLRSYLLKKSEWAVSKIDLLILLFPNEDRSSFSTTLITLALKLAEKDSQPDILYIAVEKLAKYCPLPVLTQCLSSMLEEAAHTVSSSLLSAIASVIPAIEGNKESTEKVDEKCIIYIQEWICSVPSNILPSVYRVAHALHIQCPHLPNWMRIANLVIERMPVYAKGKRKEEAALIGAISRNGNYRYILTLLGKHTPWSKKTLRHSYICVIKSLPFSKLAETVLFLLSMLANGAVPAQRYFICCISSLFTYAGENSLSCREAVPLIIPFLSVCAKSAATSVRQAFCTLVRAVLLFCWGQPSDYPIVVHLLNLTFPLLHDPKLSASILDILLLFSERLSKEFIIKYITPGLVHRSSKVREIHKKAYLLIRDSSNGLKIIYK